MIRGEIDRSTEVTTLFVDHGDGTGTRTTYHPDGTVDSVEQLTGLPYDPPTVPDDALLTVTDIRDTTKLRSTP